MSEFRWVGDRLNDVGKGVADSFGSVLRDQNWRLHGDYSSRGDSRDDAGKAEEEEETSRRPWNSSETDDSSDDSPDHSSDGSDSNSASAFSNASRSPAENSAKPSWDYCGLSDDCGCSLPKVCADDSHRCTRSKVCVRHDDHPCERRKMCSDLSCRCGRPKVILKRQREGGIVGSVLGGALALGAVALIGSVILGALTASTASKKK
jgi:hypothetical protein